MSFPRPISKEIMKKVILKSLNDFPNDPSWDKVTIVKLRIPRQLDLDDSSLALEEEELAELAMRELEREDLIRPDPTQTTNFKVITKKGKEVVKESIENMILPSIDIAEVITRSDLLNEVLNPYMDGDYDNTIFKAFKLVEVKVRNKAGLPASTVGVNLITDAFNPNSGKLEHPEAQTTSEKEGLHLLFRGAIMWFKNPSSHRYININDLKKVVQAIAFANLLLDKIDECNLK